MHLGRAKMHDDFGAVYTSNQVFNSLGFYTQMGEFYRLIQLSQFSRGEMLGSNVIVVRLAGCSQRTETSVNMSIQQMLVPTYLSLS